MPCSLRRLGLIDISAGASQSEAVPDIVKTWAGMVCGTSESDLP
jgi:hypothetical protein